MDLAAKEEILRVGTYLFLLYAATKRLKKDEKILSKRKGFNHIPDWMFKLTFWNSLGGVFYFTFLIALGAIAIAFTDMFLKPRLPVGFLAGDLPRVLIQFAEVSILLWLAFLIGKKIWKTWAGFKLNFWDLAAFTYYTGFVALLAASLFNYTEGRMASYASAGPPLNVLVSLLVILAECSLIAWLAFEGWLRIWSTIQEKGNPQNRQTSNP